ncbi:alpha/beta fold hydrolase [Maribacter thermophilus]|uniref:alpha/beta fold hydrolase n=1 Tax=Maribacter thermophilus TaxID=1197874 RepID=UPI000641114A|nr:alpha/beta hydrolase [Maribacter thermophilus]
MSQEIQSSELLLPTSNITLNYQEAGNGDHTVILIHGLGSNTKAYQKNIPALSQKARVVALDLPGFGNTTLGDFVPGIDNYAKVVSEFITLKKYSHVTLVGHSMGGQIALQLAASQQPEWLKNMVLLAPAGLEQFTQEDKNWFQAVVNDQLYLNLTDAQIQQNFDINFYGAKVPDDAQFMVNDRFKIKEDTEKYKTYVSTVVQSIHAMLAEPVYDKIVDIKVPIQVIYGKNDMLIPNKILHPQLSLDDLLEKLRADYPKIKTTLLDKAGHFVLWDQSDAVNTCIIETLEDK